MIVVVEGISAAGKTSWCCTHAGDAVVPEDRSTATAPDRDADPFAAGAFWAACNAERWQAALATERVHGLAVCDTDPFKLHYVWTLWQVGAATEASWLAEREAARRAVAEQRLGFADLVLVQPIDPAVARLRRDGDPARSRRNFELHLRLQPALLAWYRALDMARPGTVRWGWPNRVPAVAARSDHYSLDAFDALIAWLDRR